ncbi:MAG: TetR/AcrR family transcriptional regulator [Deltaproteobacteria bacterium]
MRKSKDKILESAKKLFHLKGFYQTSIDEILSDSGVTKSNFYYHFKSKEELGLIYLDRRIKQYETEVLSTTLENNSESPASRIDKFYKKVKTFHTDLSCVKGCPFGNLAIEMSGANENFRERLSTFFRRWEKSIEECIEEGMSNGEFRSDISPKIMSRLILSHLEGAVMMVKTHRSIDPLSSGSETMIKLLKAA